MGSYIHDNTQIFFTGSVTHDYENQRAQQYTINITALPPEESYILWANRNYSQTGFKVRRRTIKNWAVGWTLCCVRDSAQLCCDG